MASHSSSAEASCSVVNRLPSKTAYLLSLSSRWAGVRGTSFLNGGRESKRRIDILKMIAALGKAMPSRGIATNRLSLSLTEAHTGLKSHLFDGSQLGRPAPATNTRLGERAKDTPAQSHHPRFGMARDRGGDAVGRHQELFSICARRDSAARPAYQRGKGPGRSAPAKVALFAGERFWLAPSTASISTP